MFKPLLRQIGGKPSKPDITMFTGGLNTCEDKTLIRDNQMPYMWNMTLNKTMSMTTRSNRTSLAWFLEDTTNWGTGEVLKMFATSDKTLLTIEKHETRYEVYELKRTRYTGKNKCEEIVDGYFVNNTNITQSDKYKTFIADNLPAGEYTFSCNVSNCVILRIYYDSNISTISSTQNTYTFTTTTTGKVMICVRNTGTTEITEDVWGQIEEGDVATQYEPYVDPSIVGSPYLRKDYVGQVEQSYYYSITECRDSINKYFMIATQSKLYKITKNPISETLEDVTDQENPIYGILAGHKNRLFVGRGIDIYISKLRQYDDFTVLTDVEMETATPKQIEESGHQLRITNANGDIKALVPYDDKLIILCERSMHVLYGDSPYSEVNQFTVVDLNNGLGCISDETYTICDKQLYWLDTDMSVYRYNGAGIVKVSEPYGGDNYASYGGISGIEYNPTKMKNFIMSSYGDCVYIGMTRSMLAGSHNDTLLVYNTKNRVWWAEDGEFSHLCMWETDTETPFYYVTDYLIGVKYNNDILIMNCLQNIDTDKVFDMVTRHFIDVPIEYAFETKTWTLNTVKQLKTLTNIWFQANATGRVAVCDYWNQHNEWDGVVTKLDENYLILGNLKKVTIRHNVQNPTATSHQGTEHQRFIIPRMYMQRINAFSIRIEGEGFGEFYMMEKEWRIR